MVTDPGPSFDLGLGVGFWSLVCGPNSGHPVVSPLSSLCLLCFASNPSAFWRLRLLFCLSRSSSGPGRGLRCVVSAEPCVQFVCAPARAHVVGQATAVQFATERLTSQGLPVKQRKNITMYHGTCGAQFHSSCGVVVEWQMYASHCTCGAQSISLVEQREMEKHLSWHMCCAVSFVIWGCAGVGNGNVVERGCGWWVDAPEHCTCAVI